MVTSRGRVGPVVYGALFMPGVPVAMVLWAAVTSDVVGLPAVYFPVTGWVATVVGLSFMFAGMYALVSYGRGLPMNAYPPPVHVRRGIYRFVAHPIYIGFGLATLGVSVATGSASGLWLVFPVVSLAMAALVMGYERHDLRFRFGDTALEPRLVSLPRATDDPPTPWQRWAIVFLVFLPWSAAFEAVYRLGIPGDAVVAYFDFETRLPVVQWTELVYASVYPLVILVPVFARSQRDLRRFAMTALVATGVVTLVYLTVPVVAPPRAFTPSGIPGTMLTWERAMSHTVAAFPSFHVIWTFIAAEAWGRTSRRLGIAAWLWALLIAASCVTTGMHAIADIVFAAVVFLVVRRYDAVWSWMLRVTERIANSWREWRIGPVRVLNHGFYAGLAGFVGFMVAGSLAGRGALWQIVAIHFVGLFGAGLWAQKLEGSSVLSRPFGYYGGVLGAIAGMLVVGTIGGNLPLLLAAVACEGPWMQATGRLRCLVQGCCHGAPTEGDWGIRYRMARSRVLHIGNLKDVPLHPTPLYSILSNLVIGALLLRLWSVGASYALIAGLYMILSGLSRFVEESYRGEPQTPRVAGMRIYQWAALAAFLLGVITTASGRTSPAGLMPEFGWPLLGFALLFGLAAGFAMGVDFPTSNRRFARLASV